MFKANALISTMGKAALKSYNSFGVGFLSITKFIVSGVGHS